MGFLEAKKCALFRNKFIRLFLSIKSRRGFIFTKVRTTPEAPSIPYVKGGDSHPVYFLFYAEESDIFSLISGSPRIYLGFPQIYFGETLDMR